MLKKWQAQKQWMKVTTAVVIGVSLGVAGAALNVSHRQLDQSPAASTVPYIVPVGSTSTQISARLEPAPSPDTQADERRANERRANEPQASDQHAFDDQIDRLKTRNRRLEALVAVLRHRAAERK